MRNILYVDLEYFISYFNYIVISFIIYYLFVVKVRVMGSGTGMGTDTKLIAHEGMGSGMGIFLKRGYGDGHYGTLPNGYPLPSLQ